jgi:hypothetical protein
MAEINQYLILNPHISVVHLSGTTDPVQNFTDSVNSFLKIIFARGPEEMY